MSERKYLKGVIIRDLVESDRDRFPGLNFEAILEYGNKMVEVGSIYGVVSKYDFEAYGSERICGAVYAEHSDVLDEDFLKVDFAKIANDPAFNQPLEIPVKFVRDLYGTNERLFKGENGRYYIRQDIPEQECAVWMSAFQHKGEWTDNARIRPNVTFVMGTEREQVKYSNWAGPIVRSEDYNKVFANGVDSVLARARAKAGQESHVITEPELQM